MPAPVLKLSPAVICEDIRQEINGKYILIGVFSADIRVVQFPIPVSFALWLPTIAEGTGSVNIEVRIVSPTGAFLAQAKANVEIGVAGRGAIPVPPAVVQIQEPGMLKFQVKVESGEWETVAEIEARQGVVLISPQENR